MRITPIKFVRNQSKCGLGDTSSQQNQKKKTVIECQSGYGQKPIKLTTWFRVEWKGQETYVQYTFHRHQIIIAHDWKSC